MDIKPLSQLYPGDKRAAACVKVQRKWEFTGFGPDNDIKSVNMILTDKKGNAMYAEIPKREIEELNDKLQVNGVYIISRFKITSTKTLYSAYPSPYMIEFGSYTEVSDASLPAEAFPNHVYSLIPIPNINVRSTGGKFIDVLASIKKVHEISHVHLTTTSGSAITRNITITDLEDRTMDIKLWGNKALEFNIDNVYSDADPRAVVVLFVGCLTKSFNYATYLSGSSACHWYFNPEIPEADAYYKKLGNTKMVIPHPVSEAEQNLQPLPPKHLEYKTLTEMNSTNPYDFSEDGYECTITVARLLPDRPWSYIGCYVCKQACASEGSTYYCRTCKQTSDTFMYRLSFVGTDGITEAEFLCFDNVAQRIIGRPARSLAATCRAPDSVPHQITAIVGLRLTVTVQMQQDNLYSREKKYKVKGIISTHPREQQPLLLPHAALPVTKHGHASTTLAAYQTGFLNPDDPPTPAKSTQQRQTLAATQSPSTLMAQQLQLADYTDPAVDSNAKRELFPQTIQPSATDNASDTNLEEDGSSEETEERLQSPKKRTKKQTGSRSSSSKKKQA